MSDIVTLINIFTPKEGDLQNFVDAQIAEYRRLDGKVDGAIWNRLHVNRENGTAVNVALFESREKYDAWIDSDLFEEHIAKIKPLLDDVSPALYEVSYDAFGAKDEAFPAAN
ncbi:antibiotic biosynthesis monooxygenase family protein [Erythrobacter rubeus]|uniref:Antibiotic biosynthesis monooxygenase n=1 Tax=Erythrobacter rubeus TaxID=2760803 RepID=A0ABR8KN99_9SPHN|nr:antibiotic biosynthesis monooxygenase [Erythrobacter rubeus]MBD2842109.1 antibiotic biosynthesis monooxygenase [Erythrobacter rubeus]